MKVLKICGPACPRLVIGSADRIKIRDDYKGQAKLGKLLVKLNLI